MKNKLATAAVFVLILTGITTFNMYYEQRPITAAQELDSQQVEQKLAENDAQAAGDAAKSAEAGKPAGDGAATPAAPQDAAPEVYKAKFETTKGDFVIEVHKEWAPLGAQRFYELVKSGFYDDNRLFRVVPGFVVQWGIGNDPAANARWDKHLKDEPIKASNTVGMVSFAAGGPNTRTTQVFINYADNSPALDSYRPPFAPFGKVVEGMDVVRSFESKYGDSLPPNLQGQMKEQGNAPLDARFPGLDTIKKATIVQ